MKTAVITGGTRGIGAAIAKAFVDDGFKVVVGARKRTSFVDELGADNARFVEMDVAEQDAHERVIAEAIGWTGQVTTYINNAGVSQWRPIGEVDDSFYTMIMDTNIKGTVWGAKAAAKVLKRGGSIININSLAGKRGSANNSIYCASKFAVTGFTQALAKELGGRGIRVNAVCPVYITTETIIGSLRDERSPAGGGDVQDYLNDFTQAQTALKRLPTGEDVGNACVYLASEKAAAITGQNINVDCGVMPS